MQQMRNMENEMADQIKLLPMQRPYQHPAFPPGIQLPHPMPTHGNTAQASPAQGPEKNLCREFQRRGACRWGDKCKFSHSQAKVMVAEMSEADEQAVQLQGTMMGMWNHAEAGLSDGERNMTPREFEEAYDAAYHFIGTDEFDQLHNEMVIMLAQEQEIGDARSSVDGWHL